MNGSASVTPVDRFGLTLFVAVTLHTVIILGISFQLGEPKRPSNPDRTLEIMVLQQPKKAEQPKKADFLAQTSQAGGGNREEKVRPTTTAPPPSRSQNRFRYSPDNHRDSSHLHQRKR